jgi:hypothetical protein
LHFNTNNNNFPKTKPEINNQEKADRHPKTGKQTRSKKKNSFFLGKFFFY